METRSPAVSDVSWLGSVVRHLRKERNLSARDLSLRCGFSESYVGKLEAGQIQPSLRAFGQIVITLDIKSADVYHLVRLEGRRGLEG